MLTHIPSTTVQDGQQKPALLPTYPQHFTATLTPRQLRATLAGQQYYQTHQHGTHATHAQLCTFLKKRAKKWQYAHTSTEWQNHFIEGWRVALLADPTAEKYPASTQAGPQGDHESWDAPVKAHGEDDDENNRFPQGEPDGPIFGGDDFALVLSAALARPNFGRDDDEEHHPTRTQEPIALALASRAKFPSEDETEDEDEESEGYTAAARPLFAPDDETEERRPAHGEPDAPVIALPIKAGEPLDTPIKAGEPTAPACLMFGPRDDGGPGWSLIAASSPRYISLPQQGSARLLVGPNSYPVFPLPINMSLLAFPTFAPEDPTVDSPIKCQARPSFIDEDDEDRSPSFGDDDDEETELGGWYRSRLPRYAQRRGGASLLTISSGYPVMSGDGRRPTWPTEPPDADRRPVFLLPANPAGSTAVVPVAQHYQQLQETRRWQ